MSAERRGAVAFEGPVEQARGGVTELVLGGLRLGGQTALPFHRFEGELPNPPRIGFEVWDVPPADWAKPLAQVYSSVWDDPAAWARLVVEEFGAELVYLRLMSVDPNGPARPVAEAVATAKAVAEAVGVPLAVVGSMARLASSRPRRVRRTFSCLARLTSMGDDAMTPWP